jgi:hypothetical protein
MRPVDSRPLHFERGIISIAQGVNDPQILPMVYRYEFVKEQRPEVFVNFGPACGFSRERDPKSQLRELEEQLTLLMDEVRGMIASERFTCFRTAFRGRRSTNAAYDAVRSLNPA